MPSECRMALEFTRFFSPSCPFSCLFPFFSAKNSPRKNFFKKIEKMLDKWERYCYNNIRADAELCNGSTTDSDSVCWGSNPYSAAKKSSFFGTRIFLSKPQAWHIIECITRLRRDIHSYIIRGGKPPLYLITRQRAFPCGLMIYKAYALVIYNASH